MADRAAHPPGTAGCLSAAGTIARGGGPELGGFRPAEDRRPAGGKLYRRGAEPVRTRRCGKVRGVQPPLRLHHARHQESGQPVEPGCAQRRTSCRQARVPGRYGREAAKLGRQDERPACPPCPAQQGTRSEEQTSELQSLMRNSYAVFCLKQKKQTKNFSSPDN